MEATSHSKIIEGWIGDSVRNMTSVELRERIVTEMLVNLDR